MPKTILFSLSFFFLFSFAHCQKSFDRYYDFLLHLNSLESYKEGIHAIDLNLSEFTGSRVDSLFYMKGVFHYKLKESDESISALQKVNRVSPELGAHSIFLSTFQNAYRSDLTAAKTLEQKEFSDELWTELKLTELAGIALLERDVNKYELYKNQYSSQFFQLEGARENLALNKEGILKIKKKSAFKAGLLSGLIPGMGKFYIGKIGEGYTTLLISTILGLQVREAYVKGGSSSARFKLFTGLFSMVYIANIWGSVVSVKIHKRDTNDALDEAILLNMHIPIRTIFN